MGFPGGFLQPSTPWRSSTNGSHVSFRPPGESQADRASTLWLALRGEVGRKWLKLHLWRLKWNIIMEVWQIMFLSKWVICRFHVNLPGCMAGGFFCWKKAKLPIGSMENGIFTIPWKPYKSTIHVGKYASPMDLMGLDPFLEQQKWVLYLRTGCKSHNKGLGNQHSQKKGLYPFSRDLRPWGTNVNLIKNDAYFFHCFLFKAWEQFKNWSISLKVIFQVIENSNISATILTSPAPR